MRIGLFLAMCGAAPAPMLCIVLMFTVLPPQPPNYFRFVRLYCGSGIPMHPTGVTQLNSSLLTISVIAVLLPAAFHTAAGAEIPDDQESKDILAVSHGVSLICLPASCISGCIRYRPVLTASLLNLFPGCNHSSCQCVCFRA